VPNHKNHQPHRQGGKNPQPARKQPAKKKRGNWLWLGLGLTGVAVVSATAGALLAVSLSTTPFLKQKLSPEEAAVFGNGDRFSSSNLRIPELIRPVNILVMGMSVLSSDVDNPPPEQRDLGYKAQLNSFNGLADTMLLIRLDPIDKRISILSIPRDTRVELDEHGVQKINITNRFGGPALTAKTVSELVEGIEIDRYIRVNVSGVEKLVDALGGVTVFIPKDLKYTDESQHLYINLKQGKQHLNGNQVLQLLRFRHDALGDLGRIQRQQMVMQALVEQSLTPATLSKIPDILPVIQSYIDSNLTVEELLAVASYGVKTPRDRIQKLILPGNFNGDGRNGVSYWLPSKRKIKAIAAQYFDQGEGSESGEKATINPARLRIAIQDSTGNRAAVQALVRKLERAGYNGVYIAERLTEPLSVTRTIAQQGDEEAAKTVQTEIGLGEVRVESSGNVGSDVTIQLGKDWVQKQK
jgi:LCP family protein required for cell wall assembly